MPVVKCGTILNGEHLPISVSSSILEHERSIQYSVLPKFRSNKVFSIKNMYKTYTSTSRQLFFSYKIGSAVP